MSVVPYLWAVMAGMCILAPDGLAASKRAVALVGDAAPRGGVFAGPSFRRPLAAAGAGRIAFRAQIVGGTTTEQIVVYDVNANEQRLVASLGQTVDEPGARIKQFLGSPAVNARGDVAFVASLNPPRDAPPQQPDAPAPAAVLLKPAAGPLEILARSGDDVGFGQLDLLTPAGFGGEATGADLAERTPALDDQGAVSFLSNVVSRSSLRAGIFVKPPGNPLSVLARTEQALADGQLTLLGPPVTSPGGAIAFRGLVERGGRTVETVFRVEDGVPTAVIQGGFSVVLQNDPFAIPQTVDEVGDTLTVNDAGDLAFTGGPLLDVSGDPGSDDLVPGLFLYRGGELRLIAWPGRTLSGLGRISGFSLGSQFGALATPPALTPGGTLVFHAALNSNTSSVLLRAEPPAMDLAPIVILGGQTPSSAPTGGTFLAAASPPAVDATGGIAFVARLADAETSEALVYVPASGPARAVRIGDAAPARGYYGGPPFFPPQINDTGTIIFKSYVARGPGSSGIFRWHDSQLEAVVCVGDLAPLEGATPVRFADLPGEASLGPAGEVAFAAMLSDGRRGIFLATRQGMRAVAIQRQGFPDPTRPAAWFRKVTGNPAIVGSLGAVVFRGTIEYPDPDSPFSAPTLVEDGLFAFDSSGFRLLAVAGSRSPEGRRYFRFRDPASAPDRTTFRAQLGTSRATGEGFFLLDPGGMSTVAVEGQALSGGHTLDSLTGRAVVDASGRVAFLGRIQGGGRSGQALLHGTPPELAPVVVTGERGPVGGVIRSLGRPALSSAGHLLFRMGVQPFTGGVAGLYLASPGSRDPAPFLVFGERAPSAVGGRFTNVNANASVNAAEDVAFLGSIAEGSSRSGIFLASRAHLEAPSVDIRLRGPSPSQAPRDRIQLSGRLRPGRQSDGLAPAEEDITLTVADSTRTLWSATIPKETLRRRGTLLRPRGSKGPGSGLARVAVRLRRDGSARLSALSSPRDLTVGGLSPLAPPIWLRLEIGDDSATASLRCRRHNRGLRCKQGSEG